MNKILTSAILMLSCVIAFAQPAEEHTLTYEELMMKEYPQDPDAVAVCLYSLEEVDINYNPGYGIDKVHRVTRRIKILKEEGKEYGDFVFYRRRDDGWHEMLVNATAVTYNIKNGELEEIPMSSKYMFRTPFSDSMEKISLSAEGVQVGSVIDFSYEMISKNWGYIDDMFLQFDIPVVKAVVKFKYPRFTNWNKLQSGYREIPMTQYLNTNTVGSAMEGRNFDEITDRMVMEHVKAFRSEAFTYYPDKYRSHVKYDLKEYMIPGMDGITSLQQSWDDIDKALRRDPFYRNIRAKSPFSKELQTIASSKTMSEKEKIAAAVELVRNKVRWNGDNYYLYGFPQKALKRGNGNNVELNCLAGSALNTIGIKCYPVMIPLRNHGQIALFHPSVNAFQCFILCAETSGGKRYFVDAALDAGWIDILAPEELAANARLLLPDGSAEWVNLQNLGTNSETYLVEMKLEDDGKASALAHMSASGECSYTIKNGIYAESDGNKALEKLFPSDSWTFESAEIADKGYSAGSSADCILTSQSEMIGGKLYLKPFIGAFHNPQDMPDRERFSIIEMPYGKNIEYHCRMDIPQGWRVADLPKSREHICPALGAAANLSSRIEGETVIIDFTFVCKDMEAPSKNYQSVRAFWERLGNIYSDAIVLERL